MTTALLSQEERLAEMLPGYRIHERIGAGGYGEVWRAEAPGGLPKAVKVVLGYHDDERATRELAALNRIKEVRHPFLLSLERIELVDGHLIIVSELATSNLKRLFEGHRESGLSGIPRKELLNHLRDTADALDYISQEYSLQHLDVKPENLLLVGGRIKVADFGLVKDLQDVNASMIGGLTPVYAAPELFDGRPTIHSDQYSLAIVFQEMLTGMLPFEGRTTAQLAAQHLHSRPRLDRLPKYDQPVIARALAKDPKERFESCREMIDRLAESGVPERTPSLRPVDLGAAVPATPLPTVKTEVISLEGIRATIAAAQEPVNCMTRPSQTNPVPYDLPPIDVPAEATSYGPTIIVGIGGVAAQALRKVHQRLSDRFGDLQNVPAVQLLLFDTDAETLKIVTEGDSQTALDAAATVLLPLRPPADYRRESSNHLQWLSRRWIFNIPRSLQTQGLRPLGRLAMVDHVKRVEDRLQRAVKAAVDPENLAASAKATGLPFAAAAPRVFLVSSISGGTGSGMVLDMAYLVRKTLRDRGLSEEGIVGLLAHCAGGNPQARELAVASAYAFLTELAHFSDLHHGYPGDATCGLPAFAAQDLPFAHAYLVHGGENLQEADFAAVADRVAQYLYCNAVTSAGEFFARCRAATPPSGVTPMLRTFGIHQLGFAGENVPKAVIDELCAALIERWQRNEIEEPEEPATSLADPTSLLTPQSGVNQAEAAFQAAVTKQIRSAGLDGDQILGHLYVTATQEMGDDPEPYLLTVLRGLCDNDPAGRLPPPDVIFAAIGRIMRREEGQETGGVCLESALQRHLPEIAATQGAALREWILSLIASPEHRLEGAQKATDHVAKYLRSLSQQVGKSLQNVREQFHALEHALRQDKKGSRDWLATKGFAWRKRVVVDERLAAYFRMRIEELTLNCVARLDGLVLSQMATLADKLRNLVTDLHRLSAVFRPAEPSTTPASERLAESLGLSAESCSGCKVDLVLEMERDFEEELRRISRSEAKDVPITLADILRRKARTIVLRELKKIALGELTAPAGKRPPMFSLEAGLAGAAPSLADCGGGRRLLLLAPKGALGKPVLLQIGTAVTTPPTVVVDDENDVFVGYEVEQLSLTHVAASVLARRYQNVEVASRLYTRIDVTWSPL